MANSPLHQPSEPSTPRSTPMSHIFPCIFGPGKKSSSEVLQPAVVLLHVICAGVLFLVDDDFINTTRVQPWYTAIYLILFVATLVQYFFTSCSSPGYVIDAMRTGNDTHATCVNVSNNPTNKSLSSATESLLGTHNTRTNSSSWLKMVMELYPPGWSSRNWTCHYCNILQPPRSKHCHDCDKCVLQFDHHCAWLGTCIGEGNHCRFWWYVFEETILCTWTVILYITFLRSNIKAWWKGFTVLVVLATLVLFLVFMLLLLLFHSYLLLTNQTTYELTRRRRILYLREIPERVHPFSKGICRNLHSFCCSRDGIYGMEAVPTMMEIEAKARPYTCIDIISCRCC